MNHLYISRTSKWLPSLRWSSVCFALMHIWNIPKCCMNVCNLVINLNFGKSLNIDSWRKNTLLWLKEPGPLEAWTSGVWASWRQALPAESQQLNMFWEGQWESRPLQTQLCETGLFQTKGAVPVVLWFISLHSCPLCLFQEASIPRAEGNMLVPLLTSVQSATLGQIGAKQLKSAPESYQAADLKTKTRKKHCYCETKG